MYVLTTSQSRAACMLARALVHTVVQRPLTHDLSHQMYRAPAARTHACSHSTTARARKALPRRTYVAQRTRSNQLCSGGARRCGGRRADCGKAKFVKSAFMHFQVLVVVGRRGASAPRAHAQSIVLGTHVQPRRSDASGKSRVVQGKIPPLIYNTVVAS